MHFATVSREKFLQSGPRSVVHVRLRCFVMRIFKVVLALLLSMSSNVECDVDITISAAEYYRLTGVFVTV